MKKMFCLLLILCLLPAAAPADGQQGTSNYLYTIHGEAVSAPPAYTLAYSLTARDYPELDALDGMTDSYVSDDAIYILCAKRLVVLNHDHTFRQAVTSYTDESGRETELDACSGVTVSPAGEIYITQSEKSQILRFNPDYTLDQVMSRPEITGYENVKYRPTKMVVDSAGRLYEIGRAHV